jgi:glycosyltransferase involved in cell wall biosynthesis
MNNIFLKKFKVEIFLFCLAVLLRVIYAIIVWYLFGNHVFVSYADGYIYDLLAENIVHNSVFSEALYYPELIHDTMRTPGYPAFLALFKFMNIPDLGIIFIQNILAGIVAVLIYRIGVNILNNVRAGLIASILFIFDPTAIYWSNLFMSDHFAGFFFILVIYFLFKKKNALAGVMLGIATLVRPVFLYLSPVFLVIFYFLYKNKINNFVSNGVKKVPLFLKKSILFFLVFFVVLFPWMMRNYSQFGTWQLSSNGWVAIHVFVSSEFSARHDVPFYWPKPTPSFYNMPGTNNGEIVPDPDVGPGRNILYTYEFSVQPFYKQYFFNLVKAYPFDYVVFHMTSFFKTLANNDYGYFMNHVLIPKLPSAEFVKWPFILFFNTIWYLLFIMSFSTVFYKKYRFWALSFLSFFVINALLTGPIGDGSSQGRYNLPFLPFIFLLGSVGVLELYEKIKKQYEKKGSMKKSLAVITQTVDEKDSNLGFFCAWIKEFASKNEKVYVIANKVGEYNLPENVVVLSLGKEKGAGKISKVLNLCKYLFKYLPKVQAVFVHMCPEYIVYGGWIARVYGKKLWLWYLHKSLTWKLRVSSIFVNNIFTAHKDGCPIKSNKVIVTGHGIDLPAFAGDSKREEGSDFNILTVGRISNSKNLLILVKTAIILQQKMEKSIKLTVVGETYLEEDKAYLEEVKKYIKDNNAENIVNFVGKVPHEEIYKYYNRADIFLNSGKTGGVDKAVLEAMASGLPVVTSNFAFQNILPKNCLFEEGSVEDLTEKIIDYKSIDTNLLKDIVFKNHSLQNTVSKILSFL